MIKHYVLLLFLCLTTSFHLEAIKTSSIRYPKIHEQNKELCARILERLDHNYPNDYTPAQRADALSRHLDSIAKEFLNEGLDLNAYTYEEDRTIGYVQFGMVPLWEGTNLQPEIPLTLFIYIWPPEQVAKEIAMSNGKALTQKSQNYFATNIHGHPITCALTVLRGTLCQENYEAARGWPFNVALKKDEETLRAGMTTFDDNQSPFIHRLFCRDKSNEPAYSLHGYGASRAKTVQDLFRKSYNRYAYHYILNADGKLSYQEW